MAKDEKYLPIVDIAITEGEPCFEGEEGHKDKEYSVLLKNKPRSCELYDRRFVPWMFTRKNCFLMRIWKISLILNIDFSGGYNYTLSYRNSVL